jgi:excisionase family DNA binding protein
VHAPFGVLHTRHVRETPIVLDPKLRPTISVREAAIVLDVAEETLYVAIRAGRFPAVHVGKRIRVPTVPLLEMLGAPNGIGTREPA